MDSEDVRHEWAERSGEYSPEYYAYYGPNETSAAVHRILDRFVGSDASVLELGCSSGRHLSELYDNGFEDLSGVDINQDAFDVMADAYPALADAGTFYCEAIEDVVGQFDDGEFDAVYSVETIQHVHPDDEWVFEELARITSDLLVTVETEGDAGTGDAEIGDTGTGDTGADDAESDDVESDAGETDDSAVTAVNYVREDVPLYYRNWNQVFTSLGFAEVETSSTKRNTIRVFRADDR